MAKLLLVDDVASNRMHLAHLAHSLGYTTVMASDGARALAVLEDNPDIACVVTDCQMPNLDGPGLIARMLADKAPQPILVYSAFLTVKEISNLLEQGATGFLSYPVSRENLGEYLQRYLSKA